MKQDAKLRVGTRNKALTIDYYRQVEKELAERKTKSAKVPIYFRKSRLSEEDQLKVAEDIRTIGRGRAMTKWRISQSTYDKIYGEMLIGKLGGV